MDSSHTSLFFSGCARESAESGNTISARNRNGEEFPGFECTRTLFADEVFGLTSISASKSLYFRVRETVYTALVTENATRTQQIVYI